MRVRRVALLAVMIVSLGTSATAQSREPMTPAAANSPATSAQDTSAERSGFAGPWRVTMNLGFYELLGLGVGRTFGGGGWRVQADVGTILVAVTGELRLQRKLFRVGNVLLGVGIETAYLRAFHSPFCCETGYAAGGRLVLELGASRGWGFAAEAGVNALWDAPFERFNGAVPSFAIRVYRTWSSGR